jgi:hypothetical protein
VLQLGCCHEQCVKCCLSEQNRHHEAQQTENIRSPIQINTKSFRWQPFLQVACSLTESTWASPSFTHLGQEGFYHRSASAVRSGIFLRTELTSHRRLVDLPLARCLSPPDLTIISYHDQIFQEPGFGTNYNRIQDLQSTHSPISSTSAPSLEFLSYI